MKDKRIIKTCLVSMVLISVTTMVGYAAFMKKSSQKCLADAGSKEGKIVWEENSHHVQASRKKETKVKLPVGYICQYPELPTGCEVTALTMVLNYYGFEVSKETMAKEYLEKTDIHGDFINYFPGDPFTEYGLGIYAPGLTKTANKFLNTEDSDYKAYDISGADMQEICEYVEQGHPVCIWTTYHLDREPKVTGTWEIDGKEYAWKSNEHCMVVMGFDREKDTLLIANPAEGIKEYSRKLIEERNSQFDKMAVVIK